VQALVVRFGLALRGTDFSFRSAGNLRGFHHCAPVRIFSVLLPAISDLLSPERASCIEGGVSSAFAVIVHQLAIIDLFCNPNI